MENYGKRIQKLCEMRGKSRARVSFELGISPSYLHRVTRGERNISLDIFILIAEYFGVSLDYLMYGKGEEVNAIDLYVMIETNLPKLSVQDRLKLISILAQ